ncbi:WD40 repeat domain-containing protein [Nocardioides anomalus]|uniref:WD40 repeat domain-containing protein n=1 Tax=Nocardioides anomalus TaxID=2712223 RepID=A0A6G6W7V3_9ACTN|nr:WD40 repeat domain-containing protein [Nocardioides anomalus]QIG41421.1 WD40 repeat domain-containing protein [Nocardioides anomalus]
MRERALVALVAVPFLLGAASASSSSADGQVAFTVQDPEIVESSGLAVVDGLVVTTNDSGNSGRLYTLDPATGETVGTTDWAREPTDVEALAPAPSGAVWVGDIGDNQAVRDSVQVAQVPVGRQRLDADVRSYDLVYPDGAHDAETLLCDPTSGRLYVGTKSPLGGTLYAAPAELSPDRPNALEPVGDVLPLATDGAFLPGGDRVVIRNYGVADVYAFPSMERLDQLRLPSQEQGEGLAVDADGSLLLSSEGQRQDVVRVEVPSPTVTLTVSGSASPSAEPTPPTTVSREDRELPESTETERSPWPWFLGGLLGVGFITVLGFSLRRR